MDKPTNFSDLMAVVGPYEKGLGKPSYQHFFLPITQRLEARFGKLPIPSVTPLAVAQFQSGLIQGGLKGSTANRYLAVLKYVYNLAILWDLAETNPVSKVKFSKEGPGRQVRLSPSEQTDLMAAVPGYVRPAVELALRIGMRKGDLLSLRVADVDLDNAQILIRDKKTQTVRMIPTTGIEVLVGALVRRAEAERDLGFNKEGWLFLSRNYERFGPAGFAREFHRAAKRCGFKDLRWHDLRHCCASDLVNSGASLPVVGRVLGHKDLKTTQRYAHLETASIREAFKKRERMMLEKLG